MNYTTYIHVCKKIQAFIEPWTYTTYTPTRTRLDRLLSQPKTIYTLNHGSPTFLWQRVTPINVAGSRSARGKITASGIHNHFNSCEIFMVYT